MTDHGPQRESLRDVLTRHGIDPDRIDLRDELASLRSALQKIASYVPSAGESPASIVIYLQTLAREAMNETPA